MTFQVFHRPYDPECDDPGVGGVRLFKSDKNMCWAVGGLDNLFEAADSGDILSHPHITIAHK